VIDNAKNLNRVRVELEPLSPAKVPAPVATLEDIQKEIARAEQARDAKQKEIARERRQNDYEQRIARLEQERKDKEERQREKREKDRDQRIAQLEQERDRLASDPTALVLPDAMVKWMEEQRIENDRQRRERELDAAIERRLLERQSQVNRVTWRGDNKNPYGMNNGPYGNNWLPAPLRYI
jgi:chromosome segregation ATPase